MKTYTNEEIFTNKYTLNEWQAFGRNDTLNLIMEEEYGLIPEEAKKKCKYKIIETKIFDSLKAQKIEMTFLTHKMYFYLFQPNDNKKHPCFVLTMHEYALEQSGEDLINEYKNNYIAPIDLIISRGYSIALNITKYVARDGYDFKIRTPRDIFSEINKIRGMSDWGALCAWAWSATKVVDYLVTLKTIDKDKLCAIGHSRGGKTSLIAGALDHRFLLSVSSCSGQSGAAISRGKDGEKIRDITTAASYWFAPNYFKYADHPEYVPFDQHQLIGLIAPRYVYIFSAQDDAWADPKSEILGCKYATQYFELYGVNGLIAPQEIEINHSYNEGHIAYHMKDGGHKIEPRDWVMVMDYFDKIKRED